jgi:nucleotide-binding universal stress UspA family protein
MSRPEIKTIVIPVDGSEHARKAALVGAALAAKFGARVILLHVLLRNTSLATIYAVARTLKVPADVLEKFKPAAPAVYDFGLTVPPNILNPVAPTGLLIEIGRRLLETERSVIEGQGVKDVAAVIEDGDVAHKILEVTQKEKANFIVMGRRGLGALGGLLSGSVSTKVSHLAAVTVVSVT